MAGTGAATRSGPGQATHLAARRGEGRAEGLLRLYERRLGRDLTEPEHTTVVPGSEVDVAYDWLFVNTARTLFGVGVRAGSRVGGGPGMFFEWSSDQ